ncbi:MAG: DASS family sodium-coupled anion symporter [Caldilineaceae bacterium]|nr:DASS family sodium-coupled anion symporter [Caldilineaceae bacterium]HRJ41004.1 DASS family sodium-coupled anion symporter [Caldilineaceae bacterium]
MAYQRSRLKSSLPRRVTLGENRHSSAPQPDDETPGHLLPLVAPPRDEQAIRKRAATRTVASKRRIQRRVTTLEVLQQPFQASVRKVFDLRRLLIVLGLTGLVLVLPTPEGLSDAGHRALALFVFTGTILALEPAPLPIAALLVPVMQIALGIDTVNRAFAPFGTPVVFLILGSLFLAEALRKHGLTRRLALYAIVVSRGRFEYLLLGLMLITGGLSMFVLNTATAAVLIPVAITIAQQVPRPEDGRKALVVLLLAIGYSSSIGAIATIMGSGENAIASGLLAQNSAFGFVDWMKYGLPLVLLLLPMVWLLLPRIFHLPRLTIDIQPAAQEIDRLGQLSTSEREIVVVLLLSVTLWVTGASLESALNLPPTLLSSAVVAIGAVALLSLEEIINWNDLRGVNWGVFFVIGAGLTLGDALTKTGASKWFASLLAPTLEQMPYMLALAMLILLAFSITQFINNVPLGAILTPVLITLAEATGIAPARLVIPTIFAVALSFTLPSGSARMTLIAVTGTVEGKEMIRSGLIIGLACAGVLLLFFAILNWVGWI